MKFPAIERLLPNVFMIKFKIPKNLLVLSILFLMIDVVQARPLAHTFPSISNLSIGYIAQEGNDRKIVMVKYDDDKTHPISIGNLKKHLRICRPYDLNYFPVEKLRTIKTIRISGHEMAALIDYCVLQESKKSFNVVQDVATNQMAGAIVPGTKWCGRGNIASNPEDLGIFSHLDKCCLDHDNCPDIIKSKETRYGLRNSADFTLLSCGCDDKFRDCLANVSKTNATFFERILTKAVGITFFDCFGATCFKEEYPIKCCKHRKPLFSYKCGEYRYDRTRTKYIQLLDPKSYPGGHIVTLVNSACEQVVHLAKWEKQMHVRTNLPDCGGGDMADDDVNPRYDEDDDLTLLREVKKTNWEDVFRPSLSNMLSLPSFSNTPGVPNGPNLSNFSLNKPGVLNISIESVSTLGDGSNMLNGSYNPSVGGGANILDQSSIPNGHHEHNKSNMLNVHNTSVMATMWYKISMSGMSDVPNVQHVPNNLPSGDMSNVSNVPISPNTHTQGGVPNESIPPSGHSIQNVSNLSSSVSHTSLMNSRVPNIPITLNIFSGHDITNTYGISNLGFSGGAANMSNVSRSLYFSGIHDTSNTLSTSNSSNLHNSSNLSTMKPEATHLTLEQHKINDTHQ